jgi:hypothetical protein
MKKYSQLVESLKDRKQPVDIRDEYITEKVFRIGDKVEYTKNNSSIIAEVLDRGPNYVTLINEGHTFKAWLSDIKPTNAKSSRDSQLYRESFIIKGYKTKNFTRDLSEQFKALTTKTDDIHALYNTVVCVDSLLGISPEALKEDFNKYKIDYNRAAKYLKKFDLQIEALSKAEDELLAYAIEEDIKFSVLDHLKIANIIADVVDVEDRGSAIVTVNKAARQFKIGFHYPETWRLVGRLFNKATQAGIKWDKTIFSPKVQQYMEIE